MKQKIKIEDFQKVEIRVGRIVEAKAPSWSEKLLELIVYFGPEIGMLKIFAGLKNHYNPEFLKGRMYLFVINLEEKRVGKDVSQGMMLAIENGAKPVPIEIIDPIKEGSKVV